MLLRPKAVLGFPRLHAAPNYNYPDEELSEFLNKHSS